MAVAFVDSFTGTGSGTSASVTGVTHSADTLYVLQVGVRSNHSVASVSGGSLTWANVSGASATGDRNQTRQEVWYAYGSPGSDFTVAITMDSSSPAIAAIVTRVSGAASSVEAAAVAGTGGTDNRNASVSVTSLTDGALLLGFTHARTRTIDTADADYTQRGVTVAADGTGDETNIYTHSRALATAGSDTMAHDLSGNSDWIAALVSIAPAASSADVTVTAAKLSIALTVHAVSVSGSAAVTAALQSLVLASHSATVSTASTTTASAGKQSLSLALHSPSVTGSAAVAANQQSLAAALHSVTVSSSVTAAVSRLAASLAVHGVTATGGATVSPAQQHVLLTIHSATAGPVATAGVSLSDAADTIAALLEVANVTVVVADESYYNVVLTDEGE